MLERLDRLAGASLLDQRRCQISIGGEVIGIPGQRIAEGCVDIGVIGVGRPVLVTVGGARLHALAAGPIIAQLYGKHVRIVALKANKDLARMNELFISGKLLPVIEGPYRLADLREAFRLFGTGDHKGKIVVVLA